MFKSNTGGEPISPGYKSFCNKWGWYKTISDLAGDKIQLFDEITSQKAGEIFGFLLYKSDKVQAEKEQINFQKKIRS